MMKSINFPDICVCVCRVACRVWLVTICGGAGHFFIHVGRKDAQSSYIVFNYFYKVIYASYTGSLRSLGNHIKIFFTIPPGVVEITWLTKTFFYLDLPQRHFLPKRLNCKLTTSFDFGLYILTI